MLNMEARMLKRKSQYYIGVTLLSMIMVGLSWVWYEDWLYPETNEAEISANMVDIAPRISGIASEIFVKNNERVNKGAPLFNIDPTPFNIQLEKAQANLARIQQNLLVKVNAVEVAKANLVKATADLQIKRKNAEHFSMLAKKGLIAEQNNADAQAELQIAKANVNAAKQELQRVNVLLGPLDQQNSELRIAKTAVEHARLNLQYTHIIAPADGLVTHLKLHKGVIVNADKPVFFTVDNDKWWVNANFKETQLMRIKPGQKVFVKLDMYPGKRFKGKVTSVSSSSQNTFALFSENTSGNWMKVSQRFAVHINLESFDAKHPFRVGASCTVKVNTQ